MRSLARFALIGLAAFALSAPVSGQRSDDQLSPRSVQIQRQGKALFAAGKLDQAQDMFETALAVDPRNRGAFVDLARVAEKQKMFGKAIRLTNKALLIEPNDLDAIAVQGEAMVQIGAIARAKTNLARLQAICPKGCVQLSSLSAAITRGPAVASAKPPPSPKSN